MLPSTENLTFSELFTDKEPNRRYNHWFFRGLDTIGKALAIQKRQSKSNSASYILGNITLAFTCGLSGLIVSPLLRFLARFGQDDFKINNYTISDGSIKSDEEKEIDIDIDNNSLRIYTLNTAMMPRLPFMKRSIVNGHFLGPNVARANAIADHVIAMHTQNNLDAVHFQEVFDPEIETILIDRLKDIFPHITSRIGASSLLKPSVSSGLLSLYRHEITYARFVRYENQMVGEESMANKGAMVVKFKKGDKTYACYNTHLHGGPGIFKKLSEWWAGNSRTRRAEQLGTLHKALKEIATDADYIIGSGDFNLHAENQRKKESRSIGLSDPVLAKTMTEDGYKESSSLYKLNHPRKGIIKYPLYKAFTDSQNIGYCEDESNDFRREPVNFHYLDREEYLRSNPGAKKSDVVRERNRQAAAKKMYSGTTFSESTCKTILDQEDKKEDNERKDTGGFGNETQLFDHVYAGNTDRLNADKLDQSTNEELRQVIVQPGNARNSDHLGVIAFFAVGNPAKNKARELAKKLASTEPGTAAPAP